MEKTSEDNDWKFEYTIKKDGKKIIRFKIYGKSEDKQTSTGVRETDTKDPLWKLLLSKNTLQYNNYRKLLNNNGFVTSRIEFSFYGETLKTP